MSINTYKKGNRGISLVEIVIGSAIMAIVLFSAASAINQIRILERSTTHIIRANYLLLEGVDVAKIFRDTSWTTEIVTLTQGVPYYLVWDSSSWKATTTESVIDGLFYRTIQLDQVKRDGDDNISVGGVGSVDPGTLKITASVSWLERSATSTRSFETYVTDLFAN